MSLRAAQVSLSDRFVTRRLPAHKGGSERPVIGQCNDPEGPTVGLVQPPDTG